MDKNLKELDKDEPNKKESETNKKQIAPQLAPKIFTEDKLATNTDESIFTKDISKYSFNKKPSKKPQKWSELDTNTFYRCLEIFGMDFSMIAEVLSQKTQRQILRKFKRERKREPDKIDAALARHKSNYIERDARTKSFLDTVFKLTSDSEVSDNNQSDCSLDEAVTKKLKLLGETLSEDTEEPIEPLEYYLRQID